jgi:hypothetical protein
MPVGFSISFSFDFQVGKKKSKLSKDKRQIIQKSKGMSLLYILK